MLHTVFIANMQNTNRQYWNTYLNAGTMQMRYILLVEQPDVKPAERRCYQLSFLKSTFIRVVFRVFGKVAVEGVKPNVMQNRYVESSSYYVQAIVRIGN